MGSCNTVCNTQTEQCVFESISHKELILSEGLKQPFKPSIIMKFQKKQGIEKLNLSQQQLLQTQHQLPQQTQKESEKIHINEENYTNSTNHLKKQEEQETHSNYQNLQANQFMILCNEQQLSKSSDISHSQKKKQLDKHKNKESSIQIYNRNNRQKPYSSFLEKHQKEFTLRGQQQSFEKLNNYSTDDSILIQSILKRPQVRKARSNSHHQKHVSFAFKV